MPIGNHMEGFELNEAYKKVFGHIREYYPDFKYRQLYDAIEAIAPDYIAAAHARRDCQRNLRYIGDDRHEDGIPVDDDEFFRLGQVYVSTTFNGATYTIEEYGERPIGCAYFDWIKDDPTD